jgi:hypothetical protein
VSGGEQSPPPRSIPDLVLVEALSLVQGLLGHESSCPKTSMPTQLPLSVEGRADSAHFHFSVEERVSLNLACADFDEIDEDCVRDWVVRDPHEPIMHSRRE